MNRFGQKRRSFLFGMGVLSISQVLPHHIVAAQTVVRQGYVIGATESEHLLHFRDLGNIFIKVGAATSSDNLAMGTQQVMVGTGIPSDPPALSNGRSLLRARRQRYFHAQ